LSMGMRGNEKFCAKIPTPSASYQIYNNLQIEFTITVALAGY